MNENRKRADRQLITAEWGEILYKLTLKYHLERLVMICITAILLEINISHSSIAMHTIQKCVSTIQHYIEASGGRVVMTEL